MARGPQDPRPLAAPDHAPAVPDAVRHYIYPTFGDERLDRITAEDVAKWYDALAPGKETIRAQAYSLLRTILGPVRKRHRAWDLPPSSGHASIPVWAGRKRDDPPMARKNYYSEEFRRDAVELYGVTEGATVAEIGERRVPNPPGQGESNRVGAV